MAILSQITKALNIPKCRSANAQLLTATLALCALVYIGTTHLQVTQSRKLSNGSATPSYVHARSIVRSQNSRRRIALMIGFPHSGQDFLQHAVHEITGTSTAMNYGQAVMSPVGNIVHAPFSSIPLFADEEEGPYAFSEIHPFPKNAHVLTRSYCAGHCLACWPKDYIKASVRQWTFECGVGRKYDKETGNSKQVYYNTTTEVAKYVHLIRNPFTNIPARFEQEHHRWRQTGQNHMMDKYPTNRIGFKRWCHDYDDNVEEGRRRKIEESHYYLKDKKIRDLAMSVPCHTDFFRFIQWHNFAFEAAQGEFKGKPMNLLYHEDLERDEAGAIKRLLEYLSLKPKIGARQEKLPAQHFNGNYITGEDYNSVKQYFKMLASDITMRHMNRYFPNVPPLS